MRQVVKSIIWISKNFQFCFRIQKWFIPCILTLEHVWRLHIFLENKFEGQWISLNDSLKKTCFPKHVRRFLIEGWNYIKEYIAGFLKIWRSNSIHIEYFLVLSGILKIQFTLSIILSFYPFRGIVTLEFICI